MHESSYFSRFCPDKNASTWYNITAFSIREVFVVSLRRSLAARRRHPWALENELPDIV